MNWLSIADQIFLINLPSRHDRLVDSIVNLNSNQVPWRRWVATADKEGAVGLKKTMKHLFEHALTINYQNILVFEDDIQFIGNPNLIIEHVKEQLPKNYDLFYLGCNLLLPAIRYSEHILHVKAAYATHAVLYSRAAMEKILTYLDEDMPYDMLLVKWIQNEGNCYCSYPMIATQRRSVSDISDINKYKGMPGLAKYLDIDNNIILWDVMMRERFELNTKHLI